MQERLSDRFDDMGPKEVIDPRQTLPFMIVFSQLPDDLASAYFYPYALMQLPTGLLVDLWDRVIRFPFFLSLPCWAPF